MRVVIDIEANGLVNPTKIWCIVCKNVDTGEYFYFRRVSDDDQELARFQEFVQGVTCFIGHNLLGYDLPVIFRLAGVPRLANISGYLDTLVISKLVDYPRQGHSVEDYGIEFGYPKLKWHDFSKYHEDMVTYCTRDVDITHRIYLKYLKVITSNDWLPSITLEHKFQIIVNDLHNNGFSFNVKKAEQLLKKVTDELSLLDEEIKREFPPKTRLLREYTPRATKFGTISKSSLPRNIGDDLSPYSVGASFSTFTWDEFNPSSHKQLIEVLSTAGWKPTDKTSTHIDAERELNRLKYSRHRTPALDIALQKCYAKLEQLQKSGWKINETNLATLPDTAPSPARTLAKRILLEARRRTLTEWLGLVSPDTGRIHGKFYGIGAWTHRMAHQNPNTANIPTDAKLYGGEMRSLWQAPRNRLLVGVDAEGIQLRIFAHYINDPEFIDALVRGRKDDKSDPHSLNKRILGDVCKTRQEAKRFIFAYLLGAGVGKLAEILGCSKPEAEEALDRLMDRYKGLEHLKSTIIPQDATRGWFVGLDGRRVKIPGDTVGIRKHLCMSGYLQNGEAIVMKKACVLWTQLLADIKDNWKIVNFVHDEWQTEVPNNMKIALDIAQIQSNSLRLVGEELGLRCPLAGSYWNDDSKDYTVGTNWRATH